ncbi:hypothetical protein HDU87_000197 [Geranomyces variabilis]|uniref:Uncharacterized protein n=1 Tax=Geranomyces variabilis TaxID=109894 RepID=A0AAD5TS66_9FUNG|nr:hypothetical protein HDU87_000197 [Geranomyces variabilis]
MRVFGASYGSSSTRQYMMPMPTLYILVYAAINGTINPATVFTSRALLNAIPQPSGVPLARYQFLLAQETRVDEAPIVLPESKSDDATVLTSAECTWEATAAVKPKPPPANSEKHAATPAPPPPAFALADLNLAVPRGSLVAVHIACRSLCHFRLGLRQHPVGDAFVEPKIPAAVDAACLHHDLELMPHGRALRAGKSVIVDNTNPDPDTRKKYVDISAKVQAVRGNGRILNRCMWHTAYQALCQHNNI